MIKEVGPEHFGYGENPLGVADLGENLLLEKLRENSRSLRSTQRAESAAFAREGDEELVRALGALDPGETGFKDATIEVSGDGRIIKPSPETIAALESLPTGPSASRSEPREAGTGTWRGDCAGD